MRIYRLLTFFILIAVPSVLSGCSIVIAPLHSKQDGQMTMILQGSPEQVKTISTATLSPTPSANAPAVVAPVIASQCPPYVPPRHEPAPRPPVFSEAERKNADLLNSKLVDYVGKLRNYILRFYQSDTDAYNDYRRQCH